MNVIDGCTVGRRWLAVWRTVARRHSGRVEMKTRTRPSRWWSAALLQQQSSHWDYVLSVYMLTMHGTWATKCQPLPLLLGRQPTLLNRYHDIDDNNSCVNDDDKILIALALKLVLANLFKRLICQYICNVTSHVCSLACLCFFLCISWATVSVHLIVLCCPSVMLHCTGICKLRHWNK